MLRLAQRISSEYRHLGIFLGLELHTIASIKANNDNVIDCAFEVVKHWMFACEKPSSVTAYNQLTKALLELGRGDLVDFVCLGE